MPELMVASEAGYMSFGHRPAVAPRCNILDADRYRVGVEKGREKCSDASARVIRPRQCE